MGGMMYLKKLKIELPYNLEILLLDIYPKELNVWLGAGGSHL
jgi:hypothetical protein